MSIVTFSGFVLNVGDIDGHSSFFLFRSIINFVKFISFGGVTWLLG